RPDDENRLEAFTQDDQERLPERFAAAARGHRERKHFWQRCFDGVAQLLRPTDVIRPDRRLELGELALHGDDETWILGARRRFDRLEGDVGVEGLVARVSGTATPRGSERLLELRQNVARCSGG